METLGKILSILPFAFSERTLSRPSPYPGSRLPDSSTLASTVTLYTRTKFSHTTPAPGTVNEVYFANKTWPCATLIETIKNSPSSSYTLRRETADAPAPAPWKRWPFLPRPPLRAGTARLLRTYVLSLRTVPDHQVMDLLPSIAAFASGWFRAPCLPQEKLLFYSIKTVIPYFVYILPIFSGTQMIRFSQKVEFKNLIKAVEVNRR